jgi:catalase
MELNPNPENFFAEVEQAAFAPTNVVPGISFSPDKMLQGRLFSYGDTQRYRLGVNYAQIPVNAPKCPYHSYHRDGKTRVDGNMGSTTSYEPNSKSEWVEQRDFREPPLAISGSADHWDFREDDDDYYSQPRALFLMLGEEERQRLFGNTARAFFGARIEVRERHIDNCTKAHPDYGTGVRRPMERLADTPSPTTEHV